MKDVDKIVLAIILGAVIIGVFVFLSFGVGRMSTGGVVKGAKEIVHFEGEYECNSNVYNCDSFDNQEDAQDVFEVCGGVGKDVHGLDKDGDGVACEGI